jgi:hypothetical protein
MWKILIIFVLSLLISAQAKEVASSGKVTAYYNRTLKGNPYMVCLAVISDTEYFYYIVPDTNSPLLNYVGKYVKFSGNIYRDSTTLKDGGLPHWLIKNVTFELKK